MGIFIQSVEGVFVILGMIVVGYCLARAGWFDEKSSKLIARLVTQIALPCYMLDTIMTDFTTKELKQLLPDLKFPVVSMLILFGISVAVARVLQIRKSRRGLFESMFFNSNTVFIGLPINMALFGSKSLPYVLVYYMANTTFFWTLGVYLIKRDGDSTEKLNLWTTVKKVFSPPLLGFMVAVILVILHIKLPAFLMSDFKYIGGLTIPLSMFFIGIAIEGAGLRQMKLSRYSLGILFGRFLLAPILMSLLVIPSGMPLLMKQVFILQSAMPVMTNAPVVAKLYGADADYAALMVTESTLLSLVVIPILMTLIKQ
ncbi:AEC family transporter [Loigolactobacillus backii]|uniref:Malate transporter n=1 Tax=Loigolactobacillus backii TaxID=375175 RepID=A0A192H0X0_9LACO|nr:AEC family transporter [Loigolactobacillus backii]ANK59071.1 malate transporter [Loigolactobacillus backii]ANK62449.1 malate transporter [Loigolactobacillus backii]ANK64060.1 malate transporter [Loigolactobacillus backii]ANK67546.1 malate transporter [Loigolactobacillus backii]ANK70539.1 malate transporter [Loigolactobacillus backii]